MTAKRYVQIFVVFLMSLAFFVEIICGLVIDPYSVFNFEHIRGRIATPNRNYVKMRYILKYPEKYNSFLFGSSCVSAIHVEKIEDVRCYNMTYSYGVPKEHVWNIKTLLAAGVHIDRIYLGVDAGSYTRSAEDNRYDPARCQYEYLNAHPLHFISLYMNPDVIWPMLKVMLSNLYNGYSSYLKGEAYVKAFYSSGATIEYNRNHEINWDASVKPTGGTGSFSYDVLKDIRDIIDICKEEHIDLIVFTNIMHPVNYNAYMNNGYLTFLEGLSEITDYYNFSGLNDIAMNNHNFLDAGHYKAEVGDLILGVIYGGKKYDGLYEQGFGWKVTKENVKDFLSIPEISGQGI